MNKQDNGQNGIGIFTLLTIVLSVSWFAASDYPFGIFTVLTIVLSVL
jgi:hypothetical protein